MENAEIVLNLWYVRDDAGYVYSLRARCYVGTGDDEEKLALLQRFAQTDYLIAQPFPVPDRFHTTLIHSGTQTKVAAAYLPSLERYGGPEVLFEEVFVALGQQLPAQTNLSIGTEPLLCITPLAGNDKGEIKPRFQSQTRFGVKEQR